MIGRRGFDSFGLAVSCGGLIGAVGQAVAPKTAGAYSAERDVILGFTRDEMAAFFAPSKIFCRPVISSSAL